MDFKIKINNIGKLKDASVSVRPLTILAGPNNTGKSFFSKTLYSVFDTMNSNLLLEKIQYHLKPLQYGLHIMRLIESKKNNGKSASVKSTMVKLIRSCSLSNQTDSQIFAALEDYPELIKHLDALLESYHLLIPDIENLKEEEPRLFDNKKLDQIKESLKSLENLKKSQTEKALAEGFSKALEENLIGNFQSNLQNLKGNETETTFIDIQNICKIIIDDSNITVDSFSFKGLKALQDSSRVIYLESPIHWKLRNALSRANRTRFFQPERKSLLVPKYFKDLNLMLTEELSGDMAFPQIFKELTKDVIKGKIIIDEVGTLQFKEHGGKTHSLPLISSGIVQFGILALLIEKKVLDKGTVLFIDEPETNLHPAWQVKMMKILFELIKEGLHIIMATHSADILKWLEVHLKDHNEDKDLIALNQMSIHKEDGRIYIVDPERNIQEKIRDIKKNLTDPFLKLFLKG